MGVSTEVIADPIRQLRAQLGKCSVASRFDKLCDQHKALVLYGARLRPSELLRVPFEAMTVAQREAIRQSLIGLCDLATTFKGLPLGRADVLPVGRDGVVKACKGKHKHKHKRKPQVTDDELAALGKLAAALAADAGGLG